MVGMATSNRTNKETNNYRTMTDAYFPICGTRVTYSYALPSILLVGSSKWGEGITTVLCDEYKYINLC